ncbi:hypothetical protein [Streptomyces sp. KR55]|uniref:hypothetical protein n=1 Tax=Streptomyces sp. KR55 TaxID=3457425 RepID=UPI003FD3ECE5
MSHHRHEEPGRSPDPVSRDLPDQQAREGEEDPWEVPTPTTDRGGDETDVAETEEPATDVPDTDEAGTGRQGAPHSATVHPEHPAPDESPA